MFLKRIGILSWALIVVLGAWAFLFAQSALAQNPDNDKCLACHSQPGMQTTLPSGETLYLTVDPNVYNGSVHGQSGQACLACHPDVDPQSHPKGPAAWQDLGITTRRDLSLKLYEAACKQCHPTQYGETQDSVHKAGMAAGDVNAAICTDCHGTHNISDPTQPRSKGSQMCERCHAAVFEQYKQSVHGSALLGQGDTRVPSCTDCHQVHSIQGPLITGDFRVNSEKICGGSAGCHASVYQDTQDGVHDLAISRGITDAAVCIDCHGTHDIASTKDWPISKPSQICERCHSEIYSRYKQSVHGAALLGDGNPDVPSCTDCHELHSVKGPLADTPSASFRLASPDICRRCHSDKARMDKYGIRADVYDTYVADFHGTTVAVFEKQAPGQQTNKPVCIDCHGVHDMKKHDDAESAVIKQNLLKTCQKCHPGATASFSDSWISHYRPTFKNTPLVFLVNLFYAILIPAVLGVMAVLVILDARKRIANRRKREQQRA